MAKHDWNQLQAEFLIAHDKTGVSVTDWCEAQGIKYSSARRYIKVRKTKARIKTVKSKEIKRKSSTKITIPNPKAAPENIKHGGYSKYFSRDITKLVKGTDLNDELDLCRARVHLVVCTMEEIQHRLKEPDISPEAEASLRSSFLKADTALDRNIARIESISKTLSSIRIDDLNEHKIIADTKRSVETTKALVINAKKSVVQTELIELNVEKTRKELGGTSKVDDYIDGLVGEGIDTVVG